MWYKQQQQQHNEGQFHAELTQSVFITTPKSLLAIHCEPYQTISFVSQFDSWRDVQKTVWLQPDQGTQNYW